MRAKAIVSHITTTNPDFLCFQEVTKTMFSLLSEGLTDYQSNITNIAYKYGIYVFWKKSIKVKNHWEFPFERYMGRELHYVEFSLSKIPLVIGTTHLESEFPDTFHKSNQFKKMFEIISQRKKR